MEEMYEPRTTGTRGLAGAGVAGHGTDQHRKGGGHHARAGASADASAAAGAAALAGAHTHAPTSAVGSIIGYRTWRVRDGKLYSLTRQVRWPLGLPIEARYRLPWNPFFIMAAVLPASLLLSLFGLVLAVVFNLIIMLSGKFGFADPLGLWVGGVLVAVSGLALPCIVLAGIVNNTRHLLSPHILSRLKGPQVFPNKRTPGIYALHAPRHPKFFMPFPERNVLLVLGTVSLWGKTIEYTEGVKGQFAHPESLTHVACVQCWQWIRLEDYQDSSVPPLHPTCDASESVLKRWRDHQLSVIRDQCPGWFRPNPQWSARAPTPMMTVGLTEPAE